MTYASEVLADSPYGYYKLDESSGATTAVDSSGNGRDMTHAAGSVAFGTAQLIVDGVTCGTFDTNDELSFNNTSITSGGLSIEAWVKTTNNTTARIIMGWHNSSNVGTKRFTLEMLASGIVRATVQPNTGSAVTMDSTSTINDGSPHHVVLTMSSHSGGTLVLYVDGVQEDTDTGTTGTVVGDNRMRLGAGGSSGTRWSGDIDEAAFYNSALSAARVSDHYDAGIGAAANDVTLAGSLPGWTGALSGTPTVTTVLAGNLPGWTGSIAGAPTAQATLAGNIPAWTGAIDVEVTVLTVEVELVGDIPGWTGSIDVLLPVGVTLGGDLPPWTGALTGEVNALDLQLDGNWPLWEGEIGATLIPATNTHNRTSGRHRRSYAVAVWEPPVVEPTDVLEDQYLTAFKIDAAPDMSTGVPVYTITEAMTKKHRTRIVVGGKDITYFRDTPTPVPTYHLIQPFLYGSGTLELPQVHPTMERLGQGALSWLKPDAVVKVQVVDVDTNEVVREDYRGLITKFTVRGKGLACILGGEITGRAADRIKPVPVFKARKDAGDMLADLVRPVARRPMRPRRGPVTGILLNTFGGMGWLEALNQVVKMTTKVDGTQRTVTFDEDDQVWIAPFKDLVTIHATAYIDDGRIDPNLVRDTSEEPNRIYATGVDDEGRKIKYAVAPGIKQGDPPDYPNSGGATISQGDTDADTDSGDGVSVMIHRLITMGFTDRQTSGDLVFDGKVTQAIKDLQDTAGLSETGVMNPATWRALWDLNATGYSLRDAEILPAAQRSYTKPWLRTSSGALAQRNPNYDHSRRKIDRQIDFGPVLEGRQHGKDLARGELSFGESNWVGTLDCHVALIRGEHNYGDPLTEADVMDPREIRPGMNVWSPNFDGGTLFHVVGFGSGETPQLVVDTKARDTLPAWQAIQRNRATRHNSTRAWLDQYRSSLVEKDSLITWDDIGGLLGNRVFCRGGRWTTFEVVAGQAGTIMRIRIETTDNEAEFVTAVFCRSIRPERLDHLINAPLTQAGTDRWSDPDVMEQLQDRVHIYTSGAHEQPLGYWPKQKTNAEGEPTGAPITGVHQDDASVGFHTFSGSGVLHVAIWADRDCWVKPGRIMWNQLEEGS